MISVGLQDYNNSFFTLFFVVVILELNEQDYVQDQGMLVLPGFDSLCDACNEELWTCRELVLCV